MFSSVLSASIIGMEVHTVSVEVDVSSGLPSFHMVGFASSQVKEAQERVRTALRNIGISLPPKRMIVNLAPADIRKEGAGFDLPVAVGILAAIGKIPQESLRRTLVMGEVSLDGSISGVRGVLAAVIHGKSQEITRYVIPRENYEEAALVQGMDLIGVGRLEEVLEYFLHPDQSKDSLPLQEAAVLPKQSYSVDFADVRGQRAAKRAAEIAVSGFHNLLLVGPPGTGKSMLAKRIPTILPPLSLGEQLELTKIYSIAGLLTKERPFIGVRPFRAPHHTASPQALAGGGRNPRPGEITLAHRGVLFLDEMPEFSRISLEILRQPLEDKQICLSRVNGTYTFPANVLLVGAMNPCPCGYYPDMTRCTCSAQEVHRYLQKISQPLLDRMDLCVEAVSVSYGELSGQKKQEETSESIRRRVEAAHAMQQQRYAGTTCQFNADLQPGEMEKFCPLTVRASRLAEQIFTRQQLSARGYHKLIKVARTIADMEASEVITESHVQEAYGYRMLDKGKW